MALCSSVAVRQLPSRRAISIAVSSLLSTAAAFAPECSGSSRSSSNSSSVVSCFSSSINSSSSTIDDSKSVPTLQLHVAITASINTE
jgi:hypothetical protein